MNRVKEALTRKLGPLPAWAWLGLSGVGLFLWRRHQSAGVAGTTAQPTDSPLTGSSTDTGQGSGSGFGGGSNGGGGDGAGGVPNQPPQAVPPTTPPPDGPPVPDPSPPPDSGPVAQPGGGDTGAPPGTRVGKLTQPARQSFLLWGGETFTTQAAFAAWAHAHGSSVAKELANHPEAASIYGNLGKSTAKAPLMFLPRKKSGSDLIAGKPSREPSPVSVRSAPPRPTIRTTHEPPKLVAPARTRSSSPVQAKGPTIEHRPVAPPKPKPKPPQGRQPLPRGFGYRK